MKPNPTNIFGRMTQPENQPRTNMFDKLHSNKPSENLFNKMSPPNNNEQNSENKSIFKMSKMPATNIFSANVNPVNTPSLTNVVTQNVNIFAIRIKTEEVKDINEVKQPIISVSDFSTPEKKTESLQKDEYQTPEEKSKPEIIEKSEEKAVKKELTKKVLEIKLEPEIVDNFSPQSPISNRMNSPSNSSSTKRLQFFPISSSSRKTEREGSGQKSEEQSVSNLSAFSSREYENSASEQFRSFEERNQSKTSSIYTFQKRSNSKKLRNNGEESIEDYEILDNEGTFSFEEKFETPKRGEEKEVHIKDEKILSTIKEIEGEESPFHRIELSDTTNKLSKASSSPPYMNDTLKSPSLSYMDDNGSSLKTSEKNIGNQIFLGFQTQEREKRHSNEIIFEHVEIHSITKSENNISTQNVFKETESKEEAEKKSSPKIEEGNESSFVEEKDQTKKEEKKVVKLKDFLLIHSASKSPENEFEKIQIKRTESESDSESHSFCSRDLGASRKSETKSIKSPFGEPTGKLSALNKRNAESTTAANIETKSKSTERLKDEEILEEKKEEKSPIALFNEVKEPSSSSPESKEEEKESEKKSEDDASSLEKTISLDYSDTTQKIESSTNTLCIKSLLTKSEERVEVKREEESEKIIEILGQERPNEEEKQEKKENTHDKDNNDDDDEIFEIPQRLQERKITFGKTFEIQSQFKIVAESIEEETKLEVKKEEHVHLVEEQKKKEEKEKPSSQEENKPKLFPKEENKPKAERSLTKVSSKPELSSTSNERERAKKESSSKREPSPKRETSSIKESSSSQKREPSPKIRETSSNNKKSTKQSLSEKYEKQRYNLRLIKNELYEAKLRNSSTILPYKNVLKTVECHKMEFELGDLLDIHQKGAKKILEMGDSTFRISCYLRFYKRLFPTTIGENETKSFDSVESETKKLETSLNIEEKWFNKIKEITKKYDLELEEEKKEIELKKQQENEKKSRSFFDIFNIKKNRFFVETNDDERNKNVLKENGKSEFVKAKSAMDLSLKEIIDILKRKSEICQEKAKLVLDKNIKHEVPRLLSLNVIKKTSKEPRKSKLMEILAKKAAAKDEENKVKKNTKYSSLFEEKEFISLSNRYEKSIYHKDMVQNFLSNLSKGQIEFEEIQERNIHSSYLTKLHEQTNEKEKEEWLRQLEKNEKLTQIKNYHENSYRAYKNIKNMFDNNKFFNNNNNHNINDNYDDRIVITVEDRYKKEMRQREQNIMNKKELNREMHKKMGDNVSIKLRNVNFRTQVFML